MSSALPPLTHTTPADAELVDAYTRYMQSRAMAVGTIRRRRSSLSPFAADVAPRSITAATPADVDDWIAGHRTPRTMHAYRSDLSVFFSFVLVATWHRRTPSPALMPFECRRASRSQRRGSRSTRRSRWRRPTRS